MGRASLNRSVKSFQIRIDTGLRLAQLKKASKGQSVASFMNNLIALATHNIAVTDAEILDAIDKDNKPAKKSKSK